MGGKAICGPVDINAFHGWQFLIPNDHSECWFGDPFHRPYYIELFNDNGWRIADISHSGMVREAAHNQLVEGLPTVEAALRQDGVEILNFTQVPFEDYIGPLYRLILTSFTMDDHRFEPIEFPVFFTHTQALVRMLTDPQSLLLYYQEGTLVGTVLGYANFIHKLCNPAGRKPVSDPGQGKEKNPVFAMKTVCIAPQLRHGVLGKSIVKRTADHCMKGYGHPLAWRRSNRKHAFLQKTLKISDITSTYVTFQHDL